MKFSFGQPARAGEEIRNTLIDTLNTLTKYTITNKYADQTKLVNKYSVVLEDSYAEMNKTFKEGYLKYCAEIAQIPSTVNVFSAEGLAHALQNNAFEYAFFAIQTDVLGGILADTEVQEVMQFVNMYNVGLGDSMTFDIKGRGLYEVNKTAYGNNVTRAFKQFSTPLTIKPEPYEASVQFDVIQMLTSNYDFGAEMAKIAVSIRTKQYQDAVTLLFAAAPLSGTVFAKGSYTKANITEVHERVTAVNQAPTVAYATRKAWATASEVVTTGFTVLDEIAKKSYIADLFGVPSVVLNQAVNTANANFDFRVDNTKIVLLSQVNDAPIKLVQENYVNVIRSDEQSGSIRTNFYKYIFSYNMGLISGAVYGVVTI